MEIKLIKNFTKGKYRPVTNSLMLHIVDDNKVFDEFKSKRIFLFNPVKNVHTEIAPDIVKYDCFQIYHALKKRDFFLFSSFKMQNETDVQIDYYRFMINDQSCRLIHTDSVKLETLRKSDNIKVFVLTEDFVLFQKYDEAAGEYDITLKDIEDDKSVRLKNDTLVKNGIDSIIPLGGNRCCFKVGDVSIGIINVNQFVSDMILNLPLVFIQMPDNAPDNTVLTDMYRSSGYIVYLRRALKDGTEEAIIYDYKNNIKKVRQSESTLEYIDYRHLCVIGDVPFVYYTDESGTHFINLNSQRESYFLSREFSVECVSGDCVITSRVPGLPVLRNKEKKIIEAYKMPDLKHRIFRKVGIYNGYVELNDDLILFIG